MNLQYYISTCREYWSLTLPPILKLLANEGVSDANVIGYNESGGMEELRPLGHIVSLRAEMPRWSMLLHDTCLPQPGFRENIERLVRVADAADADLVGFREDIMPCNIGLYRSDFILRNISKIKEYESLTKRQKVEREITGWMPSMAKKYMGIRCADNWLCKIDLYGMGERWLREFPAAKMFKTTKYRDISEIG